MEQISTNGEWYTLAQRALNIVCNQNEIESMARYKYVTEIENKIPIDAIQLDYFMAIHRQIQSNRSNHQREFKNDKYSIIDIYSQSLHTNFGLNKVHDFKTQNDLHPIAKLLTLKGYCVITFDPLSTSRLMTVYVQHYSGKLFLEKEHLTHTIFKPLAPLEPILPISMQTIISNLEYSSSDED